MNYTFHELKHMKVGDLREIAKGLDDETLQGHTTMHKAPLVEVLCKVLGIETHEHHDVSGIDKTTIKRQIRELKVKRDQALDAHDHEELKIVRRRIHALKRSIHKATV